MKNTFIIFSIFIILLLTQNISLGAGTPGYQPLTPIPGLTSGSITTGATDGVSSTGFASYLRSLYIWGVAAASGLAVVMIMWGGVEYMTSAGGSGVEEAKKRMSSAIMGLLLALGSYIILSTINRNLLNLQFGIGELNVTVNKNAGVKVIPQTSATPMYYTPANPNSSANAVYNTPQTQTNSSTNDPLNSGLGNDVNLTTPEPISQSSDAPNPLLPSLNQEKTALPGQ